MMTDTKDKLISAATEYDRKQSTKRSYNPYALSQYFAAIDEVILEVDRGVSVETALAHHFNDRLLATLQRAVR